MVPPPPEVPVPAERRPKLSASVMVIVSPALRASGSATEMPETGLVVPIMASTGPGTEIVGGKLAPATSVIVLSLPL